MYSSPEGTSAKPTPRVTSKPTFRVLFFVIFSFSNAVSCLKKLFSKKNIQNTYSFSTFEAGPGNPGKGKEWEGGEAGQLPCSTQSGGLPGILSVSPPSPVLDSLDLLQTYSFRLGMPTSTCGGRTESCPSSGQTLQSTMFRGIAMNSQTYS